MTPNVPGTDGPSYDGTTPPVHRYAIYSILFGLGALACLFFFGFGTLALGVPSITTGIQARREIAASKGGLGGDGAAVIGLTIGGGALLFGLLGLLLDAAFPS